MDTTQLLLTVTLTITTILLIVVGIQLVFVLKELRKTLVKVNTIITGFEKIGFSLDHGLKEVGGFILGLKTLSKIIDRFQTKKNAK